MVRRFNNNFVPRNTGLGINESAKITFLQARKRYGKLPSVSPKGRIMKMAEKTSLEILNLK